MRRDERPATIDNFFAISFERIGRVVEAYAKAQNMFRTESTPDPIFSDTLSLDLSNVEPSLAGPRRPQDRVPLVKSKQMFQEALPAPRMKRLPKTHS